jgi:formylglycine-generating enzyme required for sulfatase activity
MEWTLDCYHDSYANASNDGSAWLEANGEDCDGRVARGDSWVNFPRILRRRGYKIFCVNGH